MLFKVSLLRNNLKELAFLEILVNSDVCRVYTSASDLKGVLSKNGCYIQGLELLEIKKVLAFEHFGSTVKEAPRRLHNYKN
jgi:hypothetical protein